MRVYPNFLLLIDNFLVLCVSQLWNDEMLRNAARRSLVSEDGRMPFDRREK